MIRIGSDVERGDAVTIIVDGDRVRAYPGETVAGALLAAGHRAWRRTRNNGEARGLFCGMGVCFDCMVTVDGRPHVRVCVTPVEDGMVVETQRELVEVFP